MKGLTEISIQSAATVHLLGQLTGPDKAFEAGGVCVCLGFLWHLEMGISGDLHTQTPAGVHGTLLGVDRQDYKMKDRKFRRVTSGGCKTEGCGIGCEWKLSEVSS